MNMWNSILSLGFDLFQLIQTEKVKSVKNNMLD